MIRAFCRLNADKKPELHIQKTRETPQQFLDDVRHDLFGFNFQVMQEMIRTGKTYNLVVPFRLAKKTYRFVSLQFISQDGKNTILYKLLGYLQIMPDPCSK